MLQEEHRLGRIWVRPPKRVEYLPPGPRKTYNTHTRRKEEAGGGFSDRRPSCMDRGLGLLSDCNETMWKRMVDDISWLVGTC